MTVAAAVVGRTRPERSRRRSDRQNVDSEAAWLAATPGLGSSIGQWRIADPLELQMSCSRRADATAART